MTEKPKDVETDQKVVGDEQRVEGASEAFNTNPCGATAAPHDHVELPSLSDRVPESWESITTDFVTIGVTSLSHLGTDMYSSPNSDFNDGVLNVQIIRSGITKKRMLDVFLAFESGGHLDLPEVEEYEIEANKDENNIEESEDKKSDVEKKDEVSEEEKIESEEEK